MPSLRSRPWRRDPSKPASGKPGAVQNGMAVRQQFGHLSASIARGLSLRHDHGSNFMADVFQKQIRFWGLAPSYAFVAEPETNGVIERLFRTLKEQAIHGRIFQTIEDVRDAVRAFVCSATTIVTGTVRQVGRWLQA